MLALILVILAGICNSVMDTVQFRFVMSRFFNLQKPLFWDPKESWVNKWKNGCPDNGERFFGSSTFLVWVTDAWHLFQSLMLVCFALAIVTYSPMINWWVDAIIYHTAFGISFEIFWRYIWRKR